LKVLLSSLERTGGWFVYPFKSRDSNPFRQVNAGSNLERTVIMNLSRLGIAVLLLTAFSAVDAQEGKTRDQVRAELAAAQRDGDLLAPGDSGLTLRELNPSRYPARQAASVKNRAQVVAELQEARRNGDIVVGDTGLTQYEINPRNFPARAVAQGKTREQVRAELAEAIRSGDIVANGDSGETLRELHPQRYATAVAHGDGQDRKVAVARN
jgi:Domain of unknown function (DUF4148)